MLELPAVLVLLLVLAGLATLAFRCRHRLRLYWGTAKKPADGVTNYQYDAFVSYSSEDQVLLLLLSGAVNIHGKQLNA